MAQSPNYIIPIDPKLWTRSIKLRSSPESYLTRTDLHRYSSANDSPPHLVSRERTPSWLSLHELPDKILVVLRSYNLEPPSAPNKSSPLRKYAQPSQDRNHFFPRLHRLILSRTDKVLPFRHSPLFLLLLSFVLNPLRKRNLRRQLWPTPSSA